ncbi:MFS transporter [Cupriavidus sp. USMAA2-4]|uniref:MFS transporter n=1 Tax=Cupriavidus malaysiensis TaxID=367825 RepID=A0ABM6F3R4_9BURK|nr:MULTISPECIES: MFS transporter [Cupriavidus]AOY90968.1 MFS transporter [Cupriavidus sp. USMAA2-4]AOZ06076.1 MFS transporter [Cupriavidus malaysiensis]
MQPAGQAAGARVPLTRFGLFYLGYYSYVGVVSPYVSLFFAGRGFSALQIGVLMACFQVTRIAGPYLWGWLSDVTHTRVRILRFTAVCALLAFLVVPGVHGYGAMVAMMLGLNLITSAMSPLGDALTISTLRRHGAFDHRYGRIRMFGSAGFIAAVLLGGALFERVGIDAFPWLASATLALFTLVVAGMRDAPEEGPRTRPPPAMPLLRRADVAWFLGASFLMMFAHAALYVFYSLYLERLGYSKFAIGVMWTIGVVAEIVFFFYQGRLFARVPLRAILAGTFLLAALRFGLTGYFGQLAWLMAAVQLLHAATFAAHHSASLKRLQHWFAGPLQGRGQALYTGISYGLGGTLGGLAMGWTWKALGPEHTFGLAALAALLGALCAWLSFAGEARPALPAAG